MVSHNGNNRHCINASGWHCTQSAFCPGMVSTQPLLGSFQWLTFWRSVLRHAPTDSRVEHGEGVSPFPLGERARLKFLYFWVLKCTFVSFGTFSGPSECLFWHCNTSTLRVCLPGLAFQTDFDSFAGAGVCAKGLLDNYLP